jgi:hypothetical protein
MSAIHQRAAKRAALPWAACAAAVLAAVAAPPVAAQATRIVIDPDTKRARAPEHDEIAAAKATANARNVGAPRTMAETLLHGQPINAQLGARGHRVDAKRLSFTVVRRQPDGSWATQCVNGESAAQHALHGNTTPAGGGHDR